MRMFDHGGDRADDPVGCHKSHNISVSAKHSLVARISASGINISV
jgi:hypothetical protein